MSGVHRLLSRRDKKRHSSSTSGAAPTSKEQDNVTRLHSPKVGHKPGYFGDVFVLQGDQAKKHDKDEDRKVKGVLERLRHFGIDSISEANVEYALRSITARGDGEAAYRLVLLLQETYEGIVRPYNPGTRMLGAENRESVTCYLDALLFAMFAHLDSFEALLYDNFEDVPRRRLAGLLRLWVNMLRTGRLITTDITRNLQEALAACGWNDAARLRQQDPSEAFTFITGKLELPLLTLKMDLYHTGKEEPQDDHKFINERLLEVAILDAPAEGRDEITLEDCLENYFNNRIEVKRHLENQRRNTLKSIAGEGSSPVALEKASALHVEIVEVESPAVNLVDSPLSAIPSSPASVKHPVDKLRPGTGRKRTDSIFSQRKVQLDASSEKAALANAESSNVDEKGRKLSTRTEVLMPAWQFFKLLPWYTDHLPESDAQVAAHFSRKRPVLGICLKRYSFKNNGQALRRNTFVDIPLEIAVPNFVSDDSMQEDGPLVGNFRLVLQSIVCHRGVSVHSGHYVCLCRGTAARAQSRQSTSDHCEGTDSDDCEDPWMRFDDLAKDRITYVDIHQALRDETPYLLFYQVQPIDDDGRSIHDLPTYAEATSRADSQVAPMEKQPSDDATEHDLVNGMLSQQTPGTPGIEATDFVNASTRNSLDVNEALRGRLRSSFGDERRPSIAFDDTNHSVTSARTETTNSVPSTPSEEKPSTFLSVANKINVRRTSRSAKNGNGSRSRPPSAGPDGFGNRFSLKDLNMSKITQKISRSNETPVIITPIQSADSVSSVALADTEAPAYTEFEQHANTTDAAGTDASGVIVGGSRNDSKESITNHKGPGSSKHRRDKEAKHGRRSMEDRECAVM